MKLIAIGVLALSAAGLGGCALPDRPVRPEPYDLGPPSAAAPADPASTPPRAPAAVAPIVWNGVSAPQTLDGTAIIYRLLYVQDGLQPRPYARARWTQTPAQLLAQRLRAALAATRPVVDADAGLTGPELRIELDDFSQVFDAPDQSFGVVRLRATRLVPDVAGGARQVEQRSFAARVPAPSSDAAGGVQALKAAADQVVGAVVAWVNGGS
ncbi:MAG: ABC-type transport auxiliary lipoprotein family protein [Burkholderiaceae bacterium]|jgi:cholesterol transport system auxiliary component|nr:ABC-type transport auxiliary lipoprotein family protein [Burkholderiaceae bacterium]